MLPATDQNRESVEFKYVSNGKTPQSRPFFTLSLDDTRQLFQLLVLIAQDSERKKIDEVVINTSNGEKWLFLFQQVHAHLSIQQKLEKAYFFSCLAVKQWLHRCLHQVTNHKRPHAIEDMIVFLLLTMAKEPQGRIHMSITFPMRHEEWKFIFVRIVE